MMADSIEPIPSDAEATSAELAACAQAQPRAQVAAQGEAQGEAQDGAPPEPENTAVNSAGIKRHILLDQLESKARASNGESGGSNGNGAGNGMSINRSSAPMSAPKVSLPPASSPAATSPGGDFDEDYVPRIAHGFEPPSQAGQAVHLHVASDLATQEILHRLYNLCQQHSGETEVWLHLDNGTEMVQLKVSTSFWVNADAQFIEDVAAVLGAANVMAPLVN